MNLSQSHRRQSLPRIEAQGGEKSMREKSFLRFPGFNSGNLKSKIENRKWLGLIAIGVAFAMCGAVVEAQQTGKVPRIGFLDESPLGGVPARAEQTWLDRGERSHHRVPVCRAKV